MKNKASKLPAFLIAFVALAFVLPAFGQASALKICSFNVQFLGSSKNRDNAALADLLKSYDIVVIQEVIAPPCEGTFPDGSHYVVDPEAKVFFDNMKANGFSFKLSEEDTGPGKKIHVNGSATEWFVAFYKTQSVKVADDLPSGFLSAQRAHNPDFDRVPYAFPFRRSDGKEDFVLISVHLAPGSLRLNKKRRKHELAAISGWINSHNQREKDFIILGDMNIENKAELLDETASNFRSLNDECLPTNTNVNGAKPYDQVMYSLAWTKDEIGSFRVINLIEAMRPYWKRRFTARYPGDAPYDHNKFRAYYSDHDPVEFRLTPLAAGDDD